MKTVGKQLQDARVAKGWSPELAARETKIRVDRLHDLEVDDYSNFSSPTYARGFVRTYARALGLDEYKILRQLDNKLPEDDNATFINDGGVPYIPEPSQVSKPFEVSRGVYLAGGVGAAVLLLIGFILIQSYRAGYFASTPASTPAIPATNALPIAPETETARALPADSSAPLVALPVDNQPVATTTAPAAAAPTDTNAAPRALPVNLADLNGTASTPAAAPAASATPATTSLVTSTTTPVVTASEPAPAPATVAATQSAPVAATPTAAAAPSIAPAPDVSPVTAPAATPAPTDVTASATVPTTTTTPPRALPVDLGATGAPASDVPAAVPADATEAPARPQPHSISARDSNSHSTVDVAAANSATDTLIASTASAEPAQPVIAQAPAPAASGALTGAPDNAPAASPVPETSSPETSTPSSLGPAVPAGTATPGSDSTSALTGAPAAPDTAAASAPAAGGDPAVKFHGQRLVLTASHDSFVRVIALDGPDAGQVRYASTLHSGQSISFNDRKYSINVADSSAIDIALDGINYGPHREDSAPDTFTVESHTP